MKRFMTISTLVVTLLLMFSVSVFSQQNHHQRSHFHPDSLQVVTVSGTVVVDSSRHYPLYFLDEEGDGQVDYHLNFGPYWYQPDSSNATRPNDGDFVTITGGVHVSMNDSISVIVVYEINGEFWRDPYEPFWHDVNGNHHRRMGGMMGFAFGWLRDTLRTVELTGTALVDSTFIYEMYFLDVDGDTIPDYFLNFGPPWYEPNSGATRPTDGEQITVVGGEIDRPTLPMVIVYEIDGQVWRDSTRIGSHLGGGWIHRNMNQSRRIHAPFDPDDWMEVQPGWHPGMGPHGGMLPDSLFGQMLQVFPQNIPNTENMPVFAGYEIGMFAGDGSNMMWQGGRRGGHMNFANQARFQLHYNEIQLKGFGIDENTIKVKYWDDQNNTWVEVSDAQVDPTNNTVTFSTNEVSSYVVLTGEASVTGIQNEDEEAILTKGFALQQNYPNPFNPSTTIEFELTKDNQVTLTIYNVLGEKLFDLVNERMSAGVHRVQFNASSLPSGIYFYELRVGNQSQVRKMNLMK